MVFLSRTLVLLAVLLTACQSAKYSLNLPVLLKKVAEKKVKALHYRALGGESLKQISRMLYGDEALQEKLALLNPGLNNTKNIVAGTVVRFEYALLNPQAMLLPSHFLNKYKKEISDRIQYHKENSGGYEKSFTTIRRGESLQSVSQRLFGTTRMWTELFVVNFQAIGRANQIEAGQRINFYKKVDFRVIAKATKKIKKLKKIEKVERKAVKKTKIVIKPAVKRTLPRTLTRTVATLQTKMEYLAVGGEWISFLAKGFYGSRKKLNLIVKLNPQLAGVRKLSQGQKVWVDSTSLRPVPENLPLPFVEKYKGILNKKIGEMRSEKGRKKGSTQVREGESLQQVSKRLYGTTRLWTELYVMNHERISNPNFVPTGLNISYFQFQWSSG